MATSYKLERPDDKTPKLYETEGLGDSALVQSHYFVPGTGIDWYVIEYDAESDICFGWAEIVPGFGEYGYTYMKEMEDLDLEVPLVTSSETSMLKVKIERDKHWTPQAIGEVLRLRGL
jgi:hypothetical protein